MTSRTFTRRDFSVRLAMLGSAVGLAGDWPVSAAPDDISRTAAAIHQEIPIAATAPRVYDALTDAAQFTKVTAFSTVPNAPPARIGRAVGEEFSLFGGHIIGRHLELVPGQRIVQAWRVANWAPGLYSIAKFVLQGASGQTTIVFDHTGFPSSEAEHLAAGWHANYWEPLTKYLH